MKDVFYLYVEDPYGYQKRFKLNAEQIIGRGDNADIFIPDMSTSRNHARLYYQDNKWYIEDLKSRLGTFLDNVRIDKAILEPNKEIRFGSKSYYFAYLLKTQKKERTRFLMLQEIFQELISKYDIKEILDLIIQKAIDLVQAERGFIIFLQQGASDKTRIYIAKDKDGNTLENDSIIYSESIINRVFEDKKTIYSTNLENDDEIGLEESVIKLSLKSILAVPLEMENEVFGLIYLDNSKAKNTFNTDDVEYMELFAKQAAIAIKTHSLIKAKVFQGRLASVGQVAAKIIHDLRNFFSTLRGYTEILESDQQSPDKKKKFIERMQTDIDKMVSYTQEILDFSKGIQDIKLEEANLNNLIDENIIQFSVLLEEKKLEIERNYDYDGRIKCDVIKLSRVIVNLIDNAIYASFENERILISTGYNKKTKEIYFSIMNAGNPISKEILPQIFEPFKSFGKKQGTGLGLAIVKQIVDNHEGRITVESKSRKGTVFTVFIPCDID
ncbi:MAG: FHA domain-containing protein [Candidatus Coatesbacteria bacterium]|nr:FHA domain-containing protein [Candidatus Coatesbacteria bacterium]